MQKRNVILIGVIIVAIIVGGIFYVMQNANIKVQNDNVKSQNETADWKTYTNIQYGFEIKYPSDYEPEGPVSGPINGQVGFVFEDRSEKSGLDNTFRININPMHISLDPKEIVSGPIATVVDGIPAQHYKTKWTWNNKEYILDYVEVKKDSSYYIFSDFGLKLDAIPFEKILSTFKFTK